MARIRTVKPEFWSDDRITECSVSARLLFIAMWNFADDAGGLDRSAKQLKARAFPHDKIDCEPLIQELLGAGLIIEYQVNGNKYLQVKNFRKHQVINRPSNSKIPLPEHSLSTPTPIREVSITPTGALPEHSLREWKGREGNGRRERQAPRGARLPVDWKPDEAARAYCQTLGLNPDGVAVDFTEFWWAKAGAGATKLDWGLTWRTWCRREAGRGKNGHPVKPKPTVAEVMAGIQRDHDENARKMGYVLPNLRADR